MIKVFTDGACSGNPGIGGWGVVILINDSDPIFLKEEKFRQLIIEWN